MAPRDRATPVCRTLEAYAEVVSFQLRKLTFEEDFQTVKLSTALQVGRVRLSFFLSPTPQPHSACVSSGWCGIMI
jgi:hypothetical protein